MKGFDADQISKKHNNIWCFFLGAPTQNRKHMNIFWRGLQLYVSSERKSGWRFTTRFTYGCKGVLIGIRACTFLWYGMLKCCAGQTLLLWTLKVYHWKSKFICEDELCANIKPGAAWKWVSDQVPNKKTKWKYSYLNILLCCLIKMKTFWRGLQLYVSPKRKSGCWLAGQLT